jgi:hypothetical protein
LERSNKLTLSLFLILENSNKLLTLLGLFMILKRSNKPLALGLGQLGGTLAKLVREPGRSSRGPTLQAQRLCCLAHLRIAHAESLMEFIT